MKISLYGVRGSIASPSWDTVRYGGNTACVFVEDGQGAQLIFDAGTGIRALGEQLLANEQPIHLFFSHYHWDHIQGFPFFKPAYQKGRKIFLLSDHLKETPHSILQQMADPHFPVPAEKLLADVQTLPIESGKTCIGPFTIQTKAANHPGSCCAYRVLSEHGSFAYVTDNELNPIDEPLTTYGAWVEFLHDTDVLLHDAMYLDHEYVNFQGWGHSLISQVLQLACDAKVRDLVLFHHEPSRSDAQLDRIGEDCNQWMRANNPNPCQVHIACEGTCYQLGIGGELTGPKRLSNGRLGV